MSASSHFPVLDV